MRTFVTFVGGDFKLPGCLLWITQTNRHVTDTPCTALISCYQQSEGTQCLADVKKNKLLTASVWLPISS